MPLQATSVEAIVLIELIGMPNILATNANLMVALAVLIEERSVTLAARRVGISQSAMSGVLAQLRELFDDPLLVRVGNAMQLTPRAQQLAARVRGAVAELDAVLQEPVVFDPASADARFVLAMTDYTELAVLPTLIAILARHAPRASLQVVHWGRLEPHPALAQGEVDAMVGMTASRRLPAGYHHTPLFEDRFQCIVRRDHPGVGEQLDLDTYTALGHVLVTEKPWADGVVDAALAKLGRRRHVVLRLSHYSLVPTVVASTDLVAAFDERVALHFARNLPIRVLEPPLSLPRGRVDLIWHERTDRDPARVWLREQVVTAASACREPATRRP